MTHHVLVGSGIAALSAAEAIRSVDPAARITMVSEETGPLYSRPGLAYLLTGALPERQLAIRSRADLAALHVERVSGRAARLAPATHELFLADGRVLPFDRLLIATGAASVAPEFPGADLDGIVTFDGIDDARALMARARKAGRALVVGGGSTAVELAEGLQALGVETHYFLRGDRYWARVLDETESALVEAGLAHRGITVHRRTEVMRALGRNGRVVAVNTNKDEMFKCQLVAVAVGVRPRVSLAQDAGLAVDRGITVTDRMESSATDVYAAGDVAQAFDPALGRAVLDTLWSAAAEQGRVAGLNMAGSPTVFHRHVALNVTQVGDVVITVIGEVGGTEDPDLITITRGQSEAWSGGSRGTNLVRHDATDRIRIHIDGRVILGAVIMGDQALSLPLTRLIADRVDIAPIRDALVGRPELLATTLLDYWHSLTPWDHAPPYDHHARLAV
jgi:NAD(P)H-nitrite reductase large subunit